MAIQITAQTAYGQNMLIIAPAIGQVNAAQ